MRSQLKNMPVSLFGAVMGFCGLALGWRLAEKPFHTPEWISEFISIFAVVIFIVIFAAYLVKVFLFKEEVVNEFNHPIAGNFFGTFTIALLLLSSVIHPYSEELGQIIWIIGVVLTIGMAYISVFRLISIKQEIAHATPAWIIPGVGVLNIPVTSLNMPFSWVYQVNILSFAIGSIWAFILIVIISSRLFHHESLPAKLNPALMIMFAPFSVGFLGYVNGMGKQVDLFAGTLFYFGLFLFCVMAPKVFRKGMPFGPSWWGVAFPMAALSNSAIVYATEVGNRSLIIVSAVLLAVVTLTFVILLIRSLSSLIEGEYIKG
jgi:tellurite resistance protein